MSRPTPNRFLKSDVINCERITLRYIELLGFQFVRDQKSYIEGLKSGTSEPGRIAIYHQRHGNGNPDFTLYENRTPIAVIEHEDLNFTPDDHKEIAEAMEALKHERFHTTCKGKDPYQPIKKKIKAAARQLRDVKDLPSMVIIHDYSGRNSTCEWSVLGAMYGSICISIPIRRGDQEPYVDRNEERNVFGDGGKFTDDPFMYENRIVSAVAILDRSHLNDLLMERTNPTDPCLEIYCNPLSTTIWPDLFGEKDTVYRIDEAAKMFVKVHQPAPPPPEPDRRSQTQIDIESIMADPFFRN